MRTVGFSDAEIWNLPIRVELEAGFFDVVAGPRDALDCLTSDWPVWVGVHRRRAIEFCRATLAGKLPSENARQAFLLAAFEAGVLDRAVAAD